MHCPRCGFENPEGMKFCGQCASPLGRRCPQCGFDNPQGFAFCGQCATPLTDAPSITALSPQTYTPAHLAEKILTSKAAFEGERQQVTVLFADLKGAMEILADRDPEEARRLLDPVLERMMEAVHRYEGTVNQVMGDGIMVLFGAPIAHGDHAVRACYAALAMQAALRRYSDEARRTHGLAVDVRVGLNSGEVVVRALDNDLHIDYLAIGQTVHAVLAARMDRLPAEEKRLLQTAAVIGTEVLLPWLQAIAERPEDALYRGMAHHALRGEVWDKALAYGRQAGEKAMTRRAFQEAVTYFEQALTAARRLQMQRYPLAQGIDLRLHLDTAFLALRDPRRTRHAPPPGPLPLGSRYPLRHDWSARACPYRPVCCYQAIPCHGDDLLVASDRNSVGTDDRAMIWQEDHLIPSGMHIGSPIVLPLLAIQSSSLPEASRDPRDC